MRAVIAGAVVVLAAVAAMITAIQLEGQAKPPSPARTAAPSPPPAPPTTTLPATGLPANPPADPSQLAAALNRAQAIIESTASSSSALASAGWFEQLATLALERERPASRGATVAQLGPQAAATVRANLAAAGALARLVTPRRSLPPWKILQPPPPATLLSYFRAAQASFGVGWQYLAAIEFIETKFGRVAGWSPAGAEGPMQFMPATWTRYGRGDVNNPRDAIFGAARYLVASGARHDNAGARYHYNPSRDYVSAVTDYAQRMRTDVRAYYGYYYWQVIYDKRGGLVLLPVGYPKVRPVPVPR
jgi:membrane-bound lytic murein transglycosylase B